jgi:hypothetical protein
MLRNYLFNVFIAIALVIVVALTVREAIATSVTTSHGDTAAECDSLPSRYSIRTETVSTIGTRLTYTEDGPTGIDGGLIHLLSIDRACSNSK